MRRALFLLVGAALVMAGAPAILASQQTYNGVGSYAPGNGYDAPIFREFAFVEGTVTQYHVLNQETFRVDQHHSRIYQFPACASLRPVLELHHPHPGDGGFQGAHDAPTREIVDVVLKAGCAAQPKSVAEVDALALVEIPRGLFVNAPIVPPQLADFSDSRLFNGPPYRPRVDAWQEGAPVKFITYEASWIPTWAAAAWPANTTDVFIISYGSMFRPGFTIFNVATGAPNAATVRSYSPVWNANCIVDAVNQKCMVSVNQQVPGYHQCVKVAECLTMTNENTGLEVILKRPGTFTHIDCPMVAVDLNGDHYIDAFEELTFPDLWVNGPVIV